MVEFQGRHTARRCLCCGGLTRSYGNAKHKVIWIPIKGIQLMEGHDAEMAQSVSAVLLSLKGAAGLNLELKYNRRGNQATLAWPVAATLASFFEKMNWFRGVLQVIAYIIACVGILMVASTMRSSMNERKDFMILRSPGRVDGYHGSNRTCPDYLTTWCPWLFINHAGIAW